jgi:hypothetical protein
MKKQSLVNFINFRGGCFICIHLTECEKMKDWNEFNKKHNIKLTQAMSWINYNLMVEICMQCDNYERAE